MKRLERLGSIAFLTITISFVFHLIGMSFNRWLDNICQNCEGNNPLATWHTSLQSRCYRTSIEKLFLPKNSTIHGDAFVADICIPNEILTAKNPNDALQCLLSSINYTHTICSTDTYDSNLCQCDYTSRTKLVVAMTVLTALSLALLLVFSHLISFTKLDYILRWLFPLCFALLIFSIVCILITIATFSATRNEDVNQLVYTSSLLSTAFHNNTLSDYWDEYVRDVRKYKYQTKVGWCFGMEILTLQFAVATLVIYILMYMTKTRPESEN